jgi:hypothetical protein
MGKPRAKMPAIRWTNLGEAPSLYIGNHIPTRCPDQTNKQNERDLYLLFYYENLVNSLELIPLLYIYFILFRSDQIVRFTH